MSDAHTRIEEHRNRRRSVDQFILVNWEEDCSELLRTSWGWRIGDDDGHRDVFIIVRLLGAAISVFIHTYIQRKAQERRDPGFQALRVLRVSGNILVHS